MSVSLQLQVIDMACYRERILPAYRAWLGRKDAGPVRVLLREVAARAPDTRSSLELSDFRRHPAFRRKSEEMASEAARGNRQAARELLELADEIRSRQDGPIRLTRGDALAAADALDRVGAGSEWDGRMGEVFSGILESLCLPWNSGVGPVHRMNSPPVAEYVRGRSHEIERMCEGGVSGERLDLSTAETTTLFSRDEAERFGRELERVGRPPEAGRTQREYDHLRQMVELVRENARFALAFTFT